MIKERYFDSKALEEYILSVCMHDKRAIVKCMTALDSARDFKDSNNAKAFGVLESFFTEDQSVDSLVVIERWVDLQIYDKATARYIFNCYNDDTDFQPKLEELKELSVFNNARQDIQDLNDMTYQDIKSEKLISTARDMVTQWTTTTNKSYKSAREIEEEIKNEVVGKKLTLGIPLIDDFYFKNAGQYKGTVRGTILREKHGKTRYACWDAAMDLLQGHKVLYCTLEGQSREIYGNFEEILEDRFDAVKDNLFIKDAEVGLEELSNTIVDSAYSEGIDKLTLDYLQLVKHPRHTYLSENENTNKCCERLTQICVKHDLLGHYLAQAKQEDPKKSKWGLVPGKYDVYGSKQLIKDCSMLQVGIRPKEYEDMIIVNALGDKVEGPNGYPQPINSVFLKTIASRKKNDYAHRWVHFVDSSRGFNLHQNELL